MVFTSPEGNQATKVNNVKINELINTSNQTHLDQPLRRKNKKFFQKLKLWYTNADTLTSSKLNELQTRTNTEHPDVICITEAYPKNSQFEVTDASLQLNGYDMFRTEGGRGVVIYIYTAHHLLATRIETKTNYHESLWCNIKISQENNFIIGGIYRSPSSCADNNDLLIELLNEITAMRHDHILITGDFNMKQIDWETMLVNGTPNSFQYRLFDTINDLFLNEMIKEPTRFRGSDTPSKLDWILTENADCTENKIVSEPLGLSDHSLISIEYDCIVAKNPDDETSYYSFFNGDYCAMREELDNIDWEDLLDTCNSQETWDLIHNKLTGLIERYVPRKKFTNNTSPPWYNRDIRILNKNKRQAWNKYRKQPTQDNWRNYTFHRNLLTHTIEHHKETYENKIASEVKHNPKQFWKYVNSKTKTKGKIVDLLDSDGNITTDDYKKAEILNGHFASVFTVEDLNNVPDFTIERNDIDILDNIDISMDAIKKHLLEINICKASGPDGINGRILKELAEQISPALKIMFEKSLSEGKLPHQWKEAHVIALFKKGNKKLANNYRPVSLTSLCCKLMEKMIRNSVVDHLEKQGLINKDQHGFRGGRSCCTQLLEVMEIWTKWFDLGLPWDTIYTDFSKAFDSVPHHRLFKKVQAYGIQGNLLRWIENFLRDRKQRVILGSHKSEWKPVTSGIPRAVSWDPFCSLYL